MRVKNGEAILGECLEEMDKLIEQGIKVDAIITDPPYNISKETNFHTMKGHRGTSMDYGNWDKGADILSWIEKTCDLLKEGGNIVIFNDWRNLGDIQKKCLSVGIEIKRCLVLDKSNPAPFNRDRLFVNNVEFAVWGVYKPKSKNKWTFNRENKLEMCTLKTTVQSKKYHSTMKDIKIISKLVKLLSNEGDIILDPFAGSFTTAVACENTNRKWIAIEQDENYFNIGIKRLGESVT